MTVMCYCNALKLGLWAVFISRHAEKLTLDREAITPVHVPLIGVERVHQNRPFDDEGVFPPGGSRGSVARPNRRLRVAPVLFMGVKRQIVALLLGAAARVERDVERARLRDGQLSREQGAVLVLVRRFHHHRVDALVHPGALQRA